MRTVSSPRPARGEPSLRPARARRNVSSPWPLRSSAFRTDARAFARSFPLCSVQHAAPARVVGERVRRERGEAAAVREPEPAQRYVALGGSFRRLLAAQTALGGSKLAGSWRLKLSPALGGCSADFSTRSPPRVLSPRGERSPRERSVPPRGPSACPRPRAGSRPRRHTRGRAARRIDSRRRASWRGDSSCSCCLGNGACGAKVRVAQWCGS